MAMTTVVESNGVFSVMDGTEAVPGGVFLDEGAAVSLSETINARRAEDEPPPPEGDAVAAAAAHYGGLLLAEGEERPILEMLAPDGTKMYGGQPVAEEAAAEEPAEEPPAPPA